VDAGWDRAALAASPWFTPLHPLLEELPDDGPPTLAGLSALAAQRGVLSGSGAPIRFVVPDAADAGYEERVYARGEVPTRPGSTHDLFNALAWLAYPRTKAAINRLHVERALANGGRRGTARDVLTLFDEDGLLLLAADETLAELLRAFRWHELFVVRRADVRRSLRFLPFGHALFDKARAPFHGLTAKTLVLPVARGVLDAPQAEQLAIADARAAEAIAAPHVLTSTRALAPLPVLGIPGWTPDNERPEYYADVTQFRPGRRNAVRA
jgi:hypothetical protein